MKEIKRVLYVYEVGDLLDISKVVAKSVYSVRKAKGFDDAERAIILRTNKQKNGMYNYDILCDTGKVCVLRVEEQGEEKFIKHVDLTDLFTEESKEREKKKQEEKKIKEEEKKIKEEKTKEIDVMEIFKDFENGMSIPSISDKYKIDEESIVTLIRKYYVIGSAKTNG